MLPSEVSRRRSEVAWLAAIVIAALLLRVVALGSDPMPELDGGFISDSGTWWKNARLHALWGVWTIDDGNYSLMTAPVYNILVRGVFALFGVGYPQAYLLNVLSGVLTILLVYAVARRATDATTSLLAAAFAGINLMAVTYSRAAYPETFQLMLMLAVVACILASGARTWLAALGGVLVVLVLLSKPPGIVLAPIASATWLAPLVMDRVAGRPPAWRGIAAYVAAAAVTLAIAVLVWFLPHRADVLEHFSRQMADGRAYGALVTDRFLLFGSSLGFRLNGFFRMNWYLVLGAALLAALRIARVIRRPVTAMEVAAWIWVVMGLGLMATQAYQQDRRFLFLVPPMAMLTALLLSAPLALDAPAWATPRARRIAWAAAFFVFALAAALYVAPFGAWKMAAAGRRLGMTWNYGMAGGLFVTLLALGAAALGLVLSPAPRVTGDARLQLGVAGAILALVLVRTVPPLMNRSHGLRDVAAFLRRVSAPWPVHDRIAVGWTASTLTMETLLAPMNHETRGPRAVERFRPQIELYSTPPNREAEQAEVWAVPGGPAKVFCAKLPVWSDRTGRPKLMVHVFVEPARLEACRAAAAETHS